MQATSLLTVIADGQLLPTN